MRIRIKEKYGQKQLQFKKGSYFVSLPPLLTGILKNLQTGVVDSVTNQFKVDTGADISIINKKYESFVKNIKPIEHMDLQYGSGPLIKDCPVYKVGIIIQGHEMELTTVYHADCKFLLLGHYQFLEYKMYCLFDSSEKFLKIYKS